MPSGSVGVARAAAKPRVTGRPEASGTSTSTVLAYLVVAAVALLPGLLLKFDSVAFGGVLADGALAGLKRSLADITFGSGMRFWFGVSGAGMMGLMLLYPLRKLLAGRRWMGRIGGWFQLHLVLGLFGPVLILYHCNFSQGSPNANMALWTMLVVVFSGIAGHFVYQSVSAGFYLGKQKARAELDAILGILNRLDAMTLSRKQLGEQFVALEAELLTPRQGIASSLAARWNLERRKRGVAKSLDWHLEHCAQQLGLSESDHQRLRGAVGGHLTAYARIARHAASQSVREQIWARWRLFHLPVFLIMVVAVVLHVVAVWGLGGSSDAASGPSVGSTVVAEAGVQSQSDGLAATASGRALPATPPAPAPQRQAALPRVEPTRAEPTGPRLVGAPQIVQLRPAVPVSDPALPPAKVSSAREAAPGLPPAAAMASPPARPAQIAPSAPRPSVVIAQAQVRQPALPPAASSPPASPANAKPEAKSEASGLFAELEKRSAELEKRTAEPPPMGLGAPKSRSLADLIVHFKGRMAAGTFAHSDAETGFALTGKHLKIANDCEDCHKKPMREQRQTTVRTCVNCHAQDDTHNGRRPDCAQCHTPTRWSQIIRRK